MVFIWSNRSWKGGAPAAAQDIPQPIYYQFAAGTLCKFCTTFLQKIFCFDEAGFRVEKSILWIIDAKMSLLSQGKIMQFNIHSIFALRNTVFRRNKESGLLP